MSFLILFSQYHTGHQSLRDVLTHLVFGVACPASVSSPDVMNPHRPQGRKGLPSVVPPCLADGIAQCRSTHSRAVTGRPGLTYCRDHKTGLSTSANQLPGDLQRMASVGGLHPVTPLSAGAAMPVHQAPPSTPPVRRRCGMASGFHAQVAPIIAHKRAAVK